MKKAYLVLIAVAFLLAGTPTQAAVTIWDYTLSGIFTDSELDNGNSLTDGTTLFWGVGNSGPSSLVINPSTVTSRVDTFIGGGSIPNTFWADSIDLTHNNNPITGASLASTTLVVSVDLDPFDPNNSPLPNQSFSFGIDFAETPNGSVPDEYDVFALRDGFPNFNFTYDSLDGDVLEYFVNVFPSTGGVLSGIQEPHASIADVPVGTLGFVTPEGQSTTLGFSFTISTEPFENPVPEPSTMLLLGFGLLGVAGVTRKKMK